jgi:hypothetical protein
MRPSGGLFSLLKPGGVRGQGVVVNGGGGVRAHARVDSCFDPGYGSAAHGTDMPVEKASARPSRDDGTGLA